MGRIQQQHANDYGSIENIQEEFQYVYQYLLSAERGQRTISDMISQMFDAAGLLMAGFVEFRWNDDKLQYQLNGNGWRDTGATVSDLQGAPGTSGSGTGDMVRATYDPNNDGRIAVPQLDIGDGDIAQIKIANLTTDLLARMVVYAQSTAPVSPTYPPSGPVTGWLDTSSPTEPVFKYWDGAGAWRRLTEEALPTTTINNGQWLAGESIASRDVVFLAQADQYGALQTGLTATASSTASGAAANVVDNVIPGTAWVANTITSDIKLVKATVMSIGMMEVYFNNATAMGFTIETSNDGSSWSPVATIASASYTVGQPAQFIISVPNSATQIRLRQTSGASAMQINEMRIYERVIERGKAYKVDADASAPARSGDVIGIALGAAALGAYFSVLAAAGEVSGLIGLSPGQMHYTSGTAGALTLTPLKNSIPVGVARTTSILQFSPRLSGKDIGDVFMYGGAIADIPPGCALADGAAFSRTQYPILFAKYGTIHGAGDGQSTANLPDLRDRFLIGARSDSGGKAMTNVTGALTQSNGAVAYPVTEQLLAGGGGGLTGGTTAAANIAVDAPPYYAAAFLVKLF